MPLINESKKAIAEEAEKIDVLGQEDEHKGAKWIKETEKERMDKEKRAEQIKEEILYDARKKKERYMEKLLADWTNALFYWSPELPKDCWWGVKPTDEGILFEIKTPDKTYKRCSKVCGEPHFDRNVIYRFITQGLTLVVPDASEEKKKLWIPKKKVN